MNERVVIAGAGVMGASLAQVYAIGGYTVTVYALHDDGLERGRRLVDLNQETLVSSGIITREESALALGRIFYTTGKNCYLDCSLVVECIVERLDAKQSFWSEISRLVPDTALLATNTSSLRIADIAAAVHLPERFMGQHWLNPPHLLPLCEIIAGEKTSADNVRKMRELVKGLGKSPVVVKDIKGFIINRLQFALLREALYIVDIGAASFEDVDTVLQAGMGLRYAALGPFGVADFGGLDTFDHISGYLNADLCSSSDVSGTLRGMAEAGMLGVKSGEGFYDYSGDRADKAIRERDRIFIELSKVLYFKKSEREV